MSNWSMSPAAKQQLAVEWVQCGYITSTEARALLLDEPPRWRVIAHWRYTRELRRLIEKVLYREDDAGGRW